MHKHVFDKLGKISSKNDMTKCIASKEHDAVTQVQTYGSIYASGTISDSRANPYNIIDPNSAGFWAAPLYVKVAIWQIVFDRQYLVEEITIQYKYNALKVAVNILTTEGMWMTIFADKPSLDQMLMITPTQILGLQIHFLELDEESPSEMTSKPAFGLKKVIMKRPG